MARSNGSPADSLERTAPGEETLEGEEPPPWHARAVDRVVRDLATDTDAGLPQDGVAERLERYGPNKLPEEAGEGPLLRFLKQFHNVLIYILIVAAVLTGFLGEWIDTGVIAAVVLVNAIVGFVQEGKAEQALDNIRKLLSLEATVVRDGRRRTIAAEEVVPGDVVLLESGDGVPADLRVVEARNARVEEAALTGESQPVGKVSDPLDPETLLADRRSMAYSGTMLTSGTLRGIVVATGERTELGRIGEMVSKVTKISTPLLEKIHTFGKWLSVAIVTLSAALFAFGWLARDYDFAELFMIVISLAVASIPEGLPAIMTITLALGVQRMAERNAIIRRLPAVETLGSVTVICSDKTGTLTRNEMMAGRVVTARGTYEVTGSGYQPEGEFRLNGQGVEPREDSALQELIRVGWLCNDAEFGDESHAEERVPHGDPTEAALVVLGEKAGEAGRGGADRWRRLDAIPFESENRFMATLNEDPDGGRWILVKGAPERVLDMCSGERGAGGNAPQDGSTLQDGSTSEDGSTPENGSTPEDGSILLGSTLQEETWHRRVEEVAGEGYRMLGLAVRQVPEDHGDLSMEDMDEGFVFLGLAGLIDPPRPEAIEAVEECRRAGIQVKMITGDHALTARSIGASMGIGDGEKVITGRELEDMDPGELEAVALEYDVFARTSPEHKLRLVEALQRHREVTAMTGDGVNDAPALKRADIGVAMGIKGSEASKSAAEMVLADDNFASIEKAVEEGRTVYDNLKKTILFILPTNGAEALMVMSAVALALAELPITPVQILWVNMVTAVTLALALAFEPPERGLMDRPPRARDEPIISPYLLWRIGFVAVIVAVASQALFFREFEGGADVDAARTLAVNVLVAGQLFYLFNSRFIIGPAWGLRRLLSNRAALLAVAVLVVLQGVFTYAPWFQTWFGTAGLAAGDWLWVLAAGLAVFLLVEVEKGVVRWYRNLPRHGARAP